MSKSLRWAIDYQHNHAGQMNGEICPGCGQVMPFHAHPCPHLAEGLRRTHAKRLKPDGGDER